MSVRILPPPPIPYPGSQRDDPVLVGLRDVVPVKELREPATCYRSYKGQIRGSMSLSLGLDLYDRRLEAPARSAVNNDVVYIYL